MDKIGQKSFRLLKKIKDPKFEIDRLEFYSLSLYIGQKDFQILITDLETDYVMLLEDFVFEQQEPDIDKAEVIRFIFDDHHLLLANFWKSINVVIKHGKYSLVPYEIFEAENISKYIGINAPFYPDDEEIMLTYHKYLDMVNVFSFPSSIVRMFSNFYPGKRIKYFHQGSTLIDGIYSQCPENGKRIAMYIDRFGMHIIVFKDKKLLFYNQYHIRKFSDYTNFIRLVARELELDLENDEILVYGYLGKHTPHFSALKKNIKQLSFGNRPTGFRYGFVFDELQEHQYFDLFSTNFFNN